MWKLLFGGPLAAIAEVAIAATKNKVWPEMGSIVYCDLALGYAEHSGVHVGAGQIIHLNGQGKIEMVSVEDFVVETVRRSTFLALMAKQWVLIRLLIEHGICLGKNEITIF